MKKLIVWSLVVLLMIGSFPLHIFADTTTRIVVSDSSGGQLRDPLGFLGDRVTDLARAEFRNLVPDGGSINIIYWEASIRYIHHSYEVAYLTLLRIRAEDETLPSNVTHTGILEHLRNVEAQAGAIYSVLPQYAGRLASEGNHELRSYLDSFMTHASRDPYVIGESLEQLIEHSRNMLQFYIPRMYSGLWNYIHVSGVNRPGCPALSFSLQAIERLEAFNNTWNSPPHFLAASDHLNATSIREGFRDIQVGSMDGGSLVNRINQHRNNEQIQLQENFVRQQFDLSLELHSQLAMVQLNDPETLQALADEIMFEGAQISQVFSGPSIWTSTSTGNAPQTPFMRGHYLREDGPALTDFFLAAFAATSIYMPFHSQMGDAEYMDALLYLLGGINDPDIEYDIRRLFGQVSQFRKPLYANFDIADRGVNPDLSRLGTSYEVVTGNLHRMRLGDLIVGVLEEQLFSMVTIPGRMQQDGDAWLYYNHMVSAPTPGGAPVPIRIQIEGAETTSADGIMNVRPVVEIDAIAWGGGAGSRGISRATFAVGRWFGGLFGRGTGQWGFGNAAAQFNNPPTRTQYWSPTPGTITSALIANSYHSNFLRSHWVDRANEPVFMNVFGDVLLHDGTIILPAAANPVFFAVPAGNNHRWWYNPFTVAFVSSYPVLGGPLIQPFVGGEFDMYKWYVGFEGPNQINNLPQGVLSLNPPQRGLDTTTNTQSDIYTFHTLPIQAQHGRTFESRDTALLWPYFTLFSPHGRDVGMLPDTRVLVEVLRGGISIRGTEQEMRSRLQTYPARFNHLPVLVGNQSVSVFPHYPRSPGDAFENSSMRTFASRRIASNMLAYITNVDNTGAIQGWNDPNTPSGNGVLREAFIFNAVISSILDGMIVSSAYVQSVEMNDLLRSQNVGAGERMLRNFASGVVDFGHNFENFIGISAPDSQSWAAPVYEFIHEFWAIIILITLMILLVVFAKTKSFTKVLVLGGTLFITVFGFLYIIPRTAPTLLGNPASILAHRIVGTTALVRGEQYAQLFSNHNPEASMGSIKLYHMTLNESRTLREELNQDPSRFMTNRVWLDDRMGIYAEGSEIRMDLDSLWSLNTMTSIYVNEWDHQSRFEMPYLTRPASIPSGVVNAHQIVINNRMANPEMVNHYMPFLYLQDGFVYTLNTFLRTYSVRRSVILYPDGFAKDAYVVPAFIRSFPFLAVLPEVQLQLRQRDIGGRETAILMRYFPDPGDIMRIQYLVNMEWNDVPHYLRETVWIRAMERNGFFCPVNGQSRRQALVNVTNDAAYRFLIEMEPNAGMVSDENLIKLTALHATFAFNRHISRFGSMVYPQHFAINQLSPSDILTSVVVHSSNAFLFYDVDLVPNVLAERGAFGLVVVILTLIIMIIISLINGFIWPLLYLGTVALVLITGVFGRNVRGALLFAVKLFAVILALNLLSITMLNLYWWFPANLNIYFLCIGLLAVLIGAIIAIKWCFASTQFFGIAPVAGATSRVRRFASRFRGGYRRPAYQGGYNTGNDDFYYQEEAIESHEMPGTRDRPRSRDEDEMVGDGNIPPGRRYSSF